MPHSGQVSVAVVMTAIDVFAWRSGSVDERQKSAMRDSGLWRWPHLSPQTREQEQIALALSDMRQAAAAARLLEKQVDVHARRALETAISTCYARPWIASNNGGKLKAKWRPGGRT